MIEWGEWVHFSEWTTVKEDWRHGNTLKFTYDAYEFGEALVRNCGGDEQLAERLRVLLSNRTMQWTLASQVRVGFDHGGFGADMVQIEIVPFPAGSHGEQGKARVSTTGALGSQDARKLSLMTVRWLMRWLLENRRDFDPKNRGSTVRATPSRPPEGVRRRPRSVLG